MASFSMKPNNGKERDIFFPHFSPTSSSISKSPKSPRYAKDVYKKPKKNQSINSIKKEKL
jgi:hypothetical protein